MAGWSTNGTNAVFDSTANASGSRSGSVKFVHNRNSPSCGSSGCIELPLTQCILVEPGKNYVFGSQVLIPLQQSTGLPGRASVGVWFINNATCYAPIPAPQIIGTAYGNGVTSQGTWTRSAGGAQAPSGAASALITVLVTKDISIAALQVNFDDLFFLEGLVSGIGGSCSTIRDPGPQVPVAATGWSRNYRNGTTTLGFRATNAGATQFRLRSYRSWPGNRPRWAAARP